MSEHRRPRPVEAPAPSRATERGPATITAPLIERIDSHLAQKIVVDANMHPASREQYRRPRPFFTMHRRRATSTSFVASAVAGEGKTLTASNLALTFSESYQRTVLLVDADLRKPSLDRIFNIEGTTGLSEGLASKDERRVAVHQVSPYLSVLSAGRAD